MTGGHDDRAPLPRRWEATGSPGAARRAAPGTPPAGARTWHTRRRIRWHGVALLASGLTLLLGVVSRVSEATTGAARTVAAPGPARLEDVAGALAGAAAIGLLLWLALALTASAVIAVLPRRSADLSPVARILAPRAVRHGVAALVSAAIIGAAAPAGADTGASPPATAVCEAEVRASRLTGPADVRDVDTFSPAWKPTPHDDMSAGWTPTTPAARPPVRQGADPSVVSAPRHRVSVDVDDEVIVRRGDTLWSVAARYLGPDATDAQIALEWPRWFTANRSVLTRGPDVLEPGTRLTPPPLVTAADREYAGSLR
jgi:nucleoid-associated protein YgaU